MMLRRVLFPVFGCIALGLVLNACSSRPNPDSAAAPGNLGKGSYKLGQPYQANGTWYYPVEDFGYNETGIASWYGPDFDQKYTANGEVFDQDVASAAHKTLAMPTVVQVTNLDNGRSIQLRINDRGPFIGNRILDVSRRAAQLLGFEQNGTAKVRVQVLVPETMQAQSIAKHNGSDVAAEDAPPPAVPHGTVTAESLPPPGSNASPQPLAAAPPPQPVQIAAAPAAAAPEAVSLMPVRPTHIFIQAGAYASGSNAMRMKAKLDALGPVVVAGTRVNGMDVYRVRIGPIATVDEADQLLTRAVGAGASDAKIVVD
jgi:rare lipoprotein A